MWMATCNFTNDELNSLGFQKVAGEELIYRHSGLQNQFWKEFPLGQPMDTVARPEHESWLMNASVVT